MKRPKFINANVIKPTILILVFLCILLMQFGCSRINSMMTRRNINNTLDEYCNRLKESEKFLSEENQTHFIDSVHVYMKNCKEYNFYDGRFEPLICYPILLDIQHKKAVVPILERGKGIKTKWSVDDRLEYVNYISGKFENGKWYFKLRTGRSESFHYMGNYPTLPDMEIGRRVVRNLLLDRSLHKGETTGEEIFKSDIYMFKNFSPDTIEMRIANSDFKSQQENEVVNEYCKRIKENQLFLLGKNQKYFEDSALSYFKKQMSSDGGILRLEPIICYPIVENENEATVSIINRCLSISGEKIDKVYAVLGKREKGVWEFQLNRLPVMVFNYSSNQPSLSDTEIGIRLLMK